MCRSTVLPRTASRAFPVADNRVCRRAKSLGKVRATARYLGAEGKLHRFEVMAYDPAGEIGRGTHQRAVISRERLLAGAARRTG